MTICSPEAGDNARGQSLRAVLLVEGELIVMSPSLKGNNYYMEPFLARLHEVHRAIAVTPVVHVPVPVPVRVPVRVRVRVTLALKFSRSPYLDNHSSKSIHTWTIDTL